jgi:dTDP-4-amino-4,6-dideoxygalactose transaminase
MQKISLLIPDLPSAEYLIPWLQRIDATRWYTNFGPLARELEEALSRQWPVAPTGPKDEISALRVVALNTGTSALELGIAALDLRPGGEVLLPALTFPATATAVLRNGLRPVFADVAPDTWQLTPTIARAAAARRPLALVMPVAVFGCPLDVEAWDAFVEETGIPVLVDAAAAFGNQNIGHRVHVSFSLHATKPFGIGEGGLFVTGNGALAARVRQLSNYGFHQEQAVAIGTNAKLSEYAAAVGLAQWARWPALQARRRAQWALYRDRVLALPGVTLQAGYGAAALPAAVVLRLDRPASSVAANLAQSGIETRRWYCPALHHHAAFSGYPAIGPAGEAGLPVTELLETHTLGLPWHNFLDEEGMARVVGSLRS